MATLPKTVYHDPTLAAADAALESANNSDHPRPYFGASTAGEACARKLWLRFRWAAPERFGAATLKAFADGHAGEDLQAKRLRLVPGLSLLTIDAETGRQFAVEAFGGHLRGHLDGAILGLLQAPKTWHCWEHKQVNEARFKALQKAIDEHGEKDALAAWDATYFAQAQLYMRYTKMRRHYLTCATPGGRQTIGVRTEYQADEAAAIEDRAESIIFAAEPPERISTDPAFWLCKWCSFGGICHGTEAPRVSCRSCANATPEHDGTWSCVLGDGAIPLEFQRKGCDEHRFIPRTIERFAELETADGNEATWRNKLTGKTFKQPGYTSHEIVAATDKRLLGDEGVTEFKTVFGTATIVSTKKPAMRKDASDDVPWLDAPATHAETPAQAPF